MTGDQMSRLVAASSAAIRGGTEDTGSVLRKMKKGSSLDIGHYLKGISGNESSRGWWSVVLKQISTKKSLAFVAAIKSV